MVWVSALTGNPKASSGRIFEAFKAGTITVVTSGTLVDEIAETLVEHMEMPPAEVERLVALLCEVAEVVPIQHQVMGCEDPDDDPVIETAITGRADFIVTRDRRLLELPVHVAGYLERAGVRVVRPEHFVLLPSAAVDEAAWIVFLKALVSPKVTHSFGDTTVGLRGVSASASVGLLGLVAVELIKPDGTEIDVDPTVGYPPAPSGD
jgi:uncharacterized protein